jgi:hypothetical protein
MMEQRAEAHENINYDEIDSNVADGREGRQ